MITPAGTEIARALELAHLFIEALNARDVDSLESLVEETIEFRNPVEGRSLHGRQGLERIVEAAAEARVWLFRHGEESIPYAHGVVRVSVPVVELVGGGEIEGTAVFEIRDGRIASFEVSSEALRARAR